MTLPQYTEQKIKELREKILYGYDIIAGRKMGGVEDDEIYISDIEVFLTTAIEGAWNESEKRGEDNTGLQDLLGGTITAVSTNHPESWQNYIEVKMPSGEVKSEYLTLQDDPKQSISL